MKQAGVARPCEGGRERQGAHALAEGLHGHTVQAKGVAAAAVTEVRGVNAVGHRVEVVVAVASIAAAQHLQQQQGSMHAALSG